MGVEPLPNIRDGILEERLVKTLRYVADMRRSQHVVQRPERVRRRQRLNVKYVDRRASDPLVLQDANHTNDIDLGRSLGKGFQTLAKSRQAIGYAQVVLNMLLGVYGREWLAIHPFQNSLAVPRS